MNLILRSATACTLLLALRLGAAERGDPVGKGFPDDFENQVQALERTMAAGAWRGFIEQCLSMSENTATLASSVTGDARTAAEAATEAFFETAMLHVRQGTYPQGLFRESLERLSRKLPPGPLRDRVFAAYGDALASAGAASAARSVFDRLGVVRDWYVVGPFDNERGSAFDTVMGPEKELAGAVSFDLDKEYRGKKAAVSWRKIRSETYNGTVNLSELLRPNEWGTAYLLTWFRTSKQGDFILSAGSDDGLKVWLDGEEVISRKVRRPLVYDQEQVRLRLGPGRHFILVKSLQEEGGWGVQIRLTPADQPGRFRGAFADGAPPKGEFAKPEALPLASDPLTKLDALLQKVVPLSADKWTVSSLSASDISSFLAKKDLEASHPSGFTETLKAEELRKLAGESPAPLSPLQAASLFFFKGAIYYGRKAFDAYKDKPHTEAFSEAADISRRPLFLFYKALAEIPTARMEAEKDYNPFLETAAQLLGVSPSNAFILELLATHYGSVKAVDTAGEYIERMPETADAKPLLQAMLDEWSGRKWKCLRDLRPYAESSFYVPGVTALARELKREKRLSEAAGLLEGLMRYAQTDENLWTIYSDICFLSGNYRKVGALIKKASALRPSSGRLFRIKLRFLESREDYEQAAAITYARISLVPQDPLLWERYGRYLDILGKNKEALGAFRKALTVEPNLVSVKRYMEVLGGTEDYAAPFRIDIKPLMAEARGYKNPKSYPALVLIDQMVQSIALDGLSSYTVHRAVKLLTPSGVEKYGRINIYHAADEQTVKVLTARVLRPDGRVDDARIAGNNTIVLPNPRVGDVVEVRYRVDDIKQTFFGNHEEQVFLFGDTVPMKVSEFVAIVPEGYTISYHLSKGDKKPDISRSGNKTVYRWRYEDTPAVDFEPMMPSLTEMVPTLYLSHFADWREFGKWYWNLIKEQHTASAELRAKVRELTKGKKTILDKIKAVYYFVTNDIEYVAWEFGVHGFKPYDTSAILERKFGDCKDKATLMKVMLGEIGVKSYQALIRSDSSFIRQDMTLPLIRHFNHAICYVPAGKDYPEMWLDGTAQYYPFGPPPPSNTIRKTCIVEEEKGGVLKEVPPPKAEDHLAEMEAEIHFTEGGGDGGLLAHVEANVRCKGLSEYMIRHYFNNEGQRKERLESIFSRRYAACKVNWLKFPDLSNMYEPCKFSFSLDLPRFTRREDRRVVMPVFQGFPRPTALRDLVVLEKRSTPLVLRFSNPYKARIVYKAPEGYRFASYPEDTEVSCDGGLFRLQAKNEGGKLVISETLAITKDRVSPEEYPDFRRFVLAVDQAESQDIVLQPVE